MQNRYKDDKMKTMTKILLIEDKDNDYEKYSIEVREGGKLEIKII